MSYLYTPELVFIQQQTANNVLTVSFTSGISTNFNNYLFTIRNVVTVNNDISIRMLFSTNGGSTYLSTAYYYIQLYVYTSVVQSTGVNTTSIDCVDSTSNVAANGANADYTLYNLANTNFMKSGYQNSGFFSADLTNVVEIGGSLNTGTAAVNAVRFQALTGNISTGTFTLYGIQEP